MLLDANAVRRRELTYAELVQGIDYHSLPAMTNELYDTIADIIKDANDAAVSFVPHDSAATSDDEIGWTLGHVVVHLTASAEEGAAQGLTLARGVAVEGRSRYEVPWESVTTIAQVEHRLQESRRMCLALLQAWPDEPNLTATAFFGDFFGALNAVGVYLTGLFHGSGHLDQLREVIRQAQA